MSDFDHEQAGPPAEFQVQIEPYDEAGVYANFLSVWHSAYEFTLEFASIQPAVGVPGVHFWPKGYPCPFPLPAAQR